MDLQAYLRHKFSTWEPAAPEAVEQTRRSVTLQWPPEGALFGFLSGLLYKVQTKTKVPAWTTVYSGGKTKVVIDNLAPSCPHRFTLQVILKAEAVPGLAAAFLERFGCEEKVYLHFGDKYYEDNEMIRGDDDGGSRDSSGESDRKKIASQFGWLTSQPSAETCVATLTRGTTPACFGMAVRCGYIKQVQQMLEENPLLLGIINSANGQTPLITAVRKGDLNTVHFLLNAGAAPEQPSAAGHTALHLALVAARLPLAELLLERGATIETRDLNGCRAEHYAADSGDVATVKFVMDRGGDVSVVDSNGWTPLFRAICQGASAELVEELVRRGSDTTIRDVAGLPLPHAARLLRNRRGGARNSVVRHVDPSYPRELAVTHFTRLTRKISSLHAVFK